MALGPGFVRTRGTRFTVNGEDFPAVGVNCYFLAYCDDSQRKPVLEAIRRTGANVIRCMAFLNTPVRPATGVSFQYGGPDGITIDDGPDGLQRLDALVEAAEEMEFRLILPLVNYWDNLGGMKTYLDWLFPGQNLNVTEFYRRPEARATYKNWIQHLLDRPGYRESSAILGWELANEPRCEINGGRELLLDWTAEMARFLKERDPNHLVALGDEGFLCHDSPPNHLYTGEHGVDFEATLGIPEIDFGTYHFYPARAQMNVPKGFGRTWIADHIQAGARANKPALLEEYGVAGKKRDHWYGVWLDAVRANSGAGALFWMFGSKEPGLANFHDEYTVYSADEIPTAAEAMREMRGSAQGGPPVTD